MVKMPNNTNLYNVDFNVNQTSIPNNGGFAIPTMTTVFDTNGDFCFPTAGIGGTPRIVIPSDNSVKWVIVGATGVMSRPGQPANAASTFPGPCYMIIQHFGSNGVHRTTVENYATTTSTASQGGSRQYVAMSAGNSQLGQSTGMNCVSPLVRVYPGDYFVLSFSHSSGAGGAGQNVDSGAQFFMEVVEGL